MSHVISDQNPISKLGDLTKPATVLIEKISEAVGGVFAYCHKHHRDATDSQALDRTVKNGGLDGELAEFAERYKRQNADEDVGLLAMQEPIRARGSMTKEELQSVAVWKSPRSARLVARNDEDYVQEVTGFALRRKAW
jgi:hypothetical protein